MNIIHRFLPKKISNTIKLALHGYQLLTKKNYFLYESGYAKSFLHQKPLNKKGEYIPWMNYTIIHFLNEKLQKTHHIFEYGSGFSTLYYAQKVHSITSVEYDLEWKKSVEQLLQENNISNATILYNEVNNDYAKSIATKPKKYNIVIDDGRNRVACAIFAFDFLTEDGVLILDDSSRDRYQEIFTFYSGKGYKELTFCGIKPMGFQNDCTTIFYKPHNCLGL